MPTLAEMRAEVQDRGFTHLSDDRVDYLLNQAYHELSEIDNWPHLYATASGAAPLTISDARTVISVFDTAQGYRKVEYTQRRRGLDPDGVFDVPLGSSPARGPANAPVTIVVFGDFECPFCTRGNITLERLRARYGDKIREVYKHNPLPFHSHAFMAARASMAAHAQGKFWKFHDELYAAGAKFDEDTLVAIAKRIGLDGKKFRKALQSDAFDAAIDADLALGAALGVNGTPAYFVNGRPVEGALPELHFRLLVEEELERAAAAIAAGTKPEGLYQALTHTPLAD